jgi:DNA-binding response OmpR family regulator
MYSLSMVIRPRGGQSSVISRNTTSRRAQPLSREQFLNATRVHEDIFDRSVDVQVLRLRRKLETDPGAPRMIQTCLAA